MKRPTRKCCWKVFLRCLLFCVFLLCMIYICKVGIYPRRCDVRAVDPDHVKRAKSFAKRVIRAECRPNFARTAMGDLFGSRYSTNMSVFLRKQDLSETLYQYSPPFGFPRYTELLEDILTMMPEDGLPKRLESKSCKRCIVIGSGGILRGLQLGSVVDQYDIVIRLNNAPVTGHAQDVGNRTTIRMTYPEGAPASKEEYFVDGLFLTVIFKHADILWLQALLKNETLSAWNKLFFWKSVVERLPLKPNQIRIVNPLVVKETSLDILRYPAPRHKRWGWEKNVPTIGVSALVLATHLCDEVSLAGFGYDLSQPDASLHYFDNLCMNAMNLQPMHDITEEKKLLQTLVKGGIVKDLSGGIHCAFCSEHQSEA
ncbi:lactosylceramide alpha-2,3-sialyltransferase [Spea bombifrons]|uniref:lactosylceramide alpha-2,3-sialyltransferase n=1 Tax=Spea bombifrons TaxID=233779 RepID=UPI00234A0A1E|nr:lactosylceramide alpha-2,3-sialyltransferase [Spea bombifrons]